MNLGKHIKDIIKQQGRTIAWVSDQLGFNERTFAGKLKRDSITGEDLLRISDLLSINLEQLKKEMLNMKITEYTILEFEGENGATPYHYNVIKLGENMYYAGYDSDKGVKIVSDIAWASHITPKLGEETIGFIKGNFDGYGKVKINA